MTEYVLGISIGVLIFAVYQIRKKKQLNREKEATRIGHNKAVLLRQMGRDEETALVWAERVRVHQLKYKGMLGQPIPGIHRDALQCTTFNGDISNWDTSKVTDFNILEVLKGCKFDRFPVI